MTESESAQLRLLIIRRVTEISPDQLVVLRDQIEALADSDSSDWVPTFDAAFQIGMNAGHLRRLCIDRLQFEGDAKAFRSRGCRMIWHVSRSWLSAQPARRRAPKTAEEQWKSLPISIVQFDSSNAENTPQVPVSNDSCAISEHAEICAKYPAENPVFRGFVQSKTSCY